MVVTVASHVDWLGRFTVSVKEVFGPTSVSRVVVNGLNCSFTTTRLMPTDPVVQASVAVESVERVNAPIVTSGAPGGKGTR